MINWSKYFKNDSMSIEEILLNEIELFELSDKRNLMITGDRYYRVENDIFNRSITRNTEDGEITDYTKANNKLAHGFARNMVDEKVTYLLANDYTLKSDNKDYLDRVKLALDDFKYKLTGLGIEASNKGIGWLYIYIDELGKFNTLMIPSEQCIPLWKDSAHTELDGMIRFYQVTVYEGREKKNKTKVEYYTKDTITYYILDNNRLIKDIDMYGGGPTSHYKKGDNLKGFGRVPFIAFKNNRIELPDIKFIKSLVDDYDKSRSDVSNFIEEVKNLIFILKNYGGQDLNEFMRDMMYFRAIKTDEDGEVNTLNPTIDIQATKEHFEQLKRDIKEFGQSVNKDLDKIGSSPSGIALKFLYSGLDLKCNQLEVEFKRGFKDLLYFINIYLSETSQGTYKDDIKIIFNRDVKINITETINNCATSKEIISDETIIGNHPWVDDIEQEIKLIEKQNKDKDMRASKSFESYNFKKVDGSNEE